MNYNAERKTEKEICLIVFTTQAVRFKMKERQRDRQMVTAEKMNQRKRERWSLKVIKIEPERWSFERKVGSRRIRERHIC
jgi:hypothetical protein